MSIQIIANYNHPSPFRSRYRSIVLWSAPQQPTTSTSISDSHDFTYHHSLLAAVLFSGTDDCPPRPLEARHSHSPSLISSTSEYLCPLPYALQLRAEDAIGYDEGSLFCTLHYHVLSSLDCSEYFCPLFRRALVELGVRLLYKFLGGIWSGKERVQVFFKRLFVTFGNCFQETGKCGFDFLDVLLFLEGDGSLFQQFWLSLAFKDALPELPFQLIA